jgi:hypothetical protein
MVRGQANCEANLKTTGLMARAIMISPKVIATPCRTVGNLEHVPLGPGAKGSRQMDGTLSSSQADLLK